jgi:threonine dehydrogenase-like Zn-dependent dehydrogenase
MESQGSPTNPSLTGDQLSFAFFQSLLVWHTLSAKLTTKALTVFTQRYCRLSLCGSQVLAVDAVAARRAKAAQFGAITADLSEAAAAVAAATGGRGADVALELVGSNAALQLGFELLRPAGVLSSIGVHTAPQFPFSPVNAYDKNLTLRCGRCPARHYMEKLLPLVQSQVWPFTEIITHRLPLSQGVEAYRMFDKKLDGCIKVVLDPWA